MTRPILSLMLAAALSLTAQASDLFPFVLPWDDASPSITNISSLLDKPAGAKGFVTAKDAHLFAGEKRLRIFGINLAFGGNFPSHEDAEKLAGRMAKFGINCVRFHHMDTSTAPAGILNADRKTLNPENLDRLDYFIAQLTKNGIYTNLNLHVGNQYPGMPKWEGGPGYYKGADNFYPPMIEQQRDYARALLTHVNPYTKLAYTDDPAVAFIEINNENGLIMEWNGGTIDKLPEQIAQEFTRQWNAWLTKKYSTQEKLAAAWNEGVEPLGAELLKNRTFVEGQTGWIHEVHEGAKVKATVVNRVGSNPGQPPVSLQLIVETPGREAWHVQVVQGGLKLEAGKPYTLEFMAKADQPRTINVGLSQNHAPWKGLASTQVKLTTSWQKVQVMLTPNDTDDNARVSITNLGSTPGEYEFAETSLKRGGISALAPGEALGAIPFFKKAEIARRTLPAQKDWNQFLIDTESAYWPGVARFIKSDLKAKSLVLGSATGFSPWLVQSQLDVVDAHAYWQHPHFPRKQWDMNDWTVKNVPMAGDPQGGTLPGLALRRVAGKPFIVTEYNHALPNEYSAEAFLEVLAIASLQDWDGVFAFAYLHHGAPYNQGKFGSFFDIDQHPAKMATLPTAVRMFYRGDLQPPTASAHIASVTPTAAVESIRRGSSWVDGKAYGLTKEETFQHPIAFGLRPDAKVDPAGSTASNAKAPMPTLKSDGPGELTWDTTAGRMLLSTPRTVELVGKVTPGETVTLGKVAITPGQTNLGWATITASVIEGQDFPTAKRILLTATGETSNTGLQWKDPATKESVGTNWGKAPSIVEGIPAQVSLPLTGKFKAWTLDEQGHRKTEVLLKTDSGHTVIDLSPDQKTLWWEIAREP